MLLTSQLEGSGDRSKSIKTALELGTYALTWSSVMRAIDFGHHPLSPIAYVHTYLNGSSLFLAGIEAPSPLMLQSEAPATLCTVCTCL